jgi:thioredoxin reductase (NADPH)
MPSPCESHNVVIVGAGPAGLSAAYHLGRAGLDCVVLERGCVADNIRRYPKNLVFYSTPERIALGDIPLIVSGEKPTRTDAVRYYTQFALHRGIDVRTYEEVVLAERRGDGFRLVTRSHVGIEHDYHAERVILAFGAYDDPNRLGVPGEDLPHVSHFYDEPERYHHRRVLIVGGKGSASEAALQIMRAGGEVTISYRQPEFRGLKYWIGPDLRNRIEEGDITAWLPSVVERIEPEVTWLRRLDTGERVAVRADFVLALTGYAPRLTLFDQLGVAYDPDSLRPKLDTETFESNVPGVYVAGCICAGNIGNEIFIENGRKHGQAIAAHVALTLAAGAAPPVV